MSTDPFAPTPEDRFSFGLWTVGNVGRDPFGEPTRPPLDPVDTVHRLAELGAWGVNFHDDDLVPRDAAPAERERIVRAFEAALRETGMVVPMATTNLFGDPAFRDGAFTSADARVRAYALQKVMRNIDLGVRLGAKTYVFWGGREGSEVDGAGKLTDALAWYREALNYLAAYVRDQGYDLRFALEPKPNEPRGDLFLPTVGSLLGFIATLDEPDRFGVNPEFAHETMAGLSFPHALAQAIDAGKLYHVDLNDQKMARFDQDLRFGAENPKAALFTVALLEKHYDGPKHFDAHALRTEDPAGVWTFAAGCMRTYKILAAKARHLEEDDELQRALAAYRVSDAELESLMRYSPDNAAALKERDLPLDTLRARGPGLERIDQRVIEILLGTP
ncbi:MAG: xylose isomerase [Trueperaceae bacterium]|nr:xylose isomerase [Trueperaceae bacterium]